MFNPEDIVKSCPKLESGLRLGREGIHACQLGPFASPIYWTADEAANLKITKSMIIEKRKYIFDLLNDENAETPCKACKMVVEKAFKNVDFSKLGHIDVAADTRCDLRCQFCGYAVHNLFSKAKYDVLAILEEFSQEDIIWSSAVDFNGGEPTFLQNFDDYIKYFNDRRIRVFLYTNGVTFKKSVYEGLEKGSIQWVCVSLDAGTPSTFNELKKKDVFIQVLENLSKYADAGRKGEGKLAVKYIFCEQNLSDDDVCGFTYAMLAIKPQKIWLTFDFEPIQSIPGDSEDFGGYDYSRHIEAYSKMFLMLKKHGLEPGHFTENHLAAIGKHGKVLMELTKKRIQELTESIDYDDVSIMNNSINSLVDKDNFSYFEFKSLSKYNKNGTSEKISLKDKSILFVPACKMSIDLIDEKELIEAKVLGLVDRDKTLQGKSINDYLVHGYNEIKKLDPDIIILASHEQHHKDILNMLFEFKNSKSDILVLK